MLGIIYTPPPGFNRVRRSESVDATAFVPNAPVVTSLNLEKKNFTGICCTPPLYQHEYFAIKRLIKSKIITFLSQYMENAVSILIALLNKTLEFIVTQTDSCARYYTCQQMIQCIIFFSTMH